MITPPITTRAPDQCTRDLAEASDVHPGLPFPRRAVITGAGLVTPLGTTAQETWRALLAGKFITDHARAAGEYDNTSPRVIQMARRAADEAMHNAGWSDSQTDDFTTIVGTSKGSIESWLPTGAPLQHMLRSAYV